MGPAIGLIVAVWVSTLIYLGYDHLDYKQDRAAFVERCISKGGVTLTGYRRHGGWIGCFKVEEIPNEVGQ